MSATPGTADASGFRRDIQGLRGLVLALILAHHAGWAIAGGGYVGLDAFYVVSGFVITTLLWREVGRAGTVSLLRFYGRRARRLLPAALTVLAAVFVASLVTFGGHQSHTTARDMLAASLYVANWHFMAQETDYFGDAEAPSPVQHYWSLSVEEQFYLLWPPLILAALAIARRSGLSRRALMVGVVAIISGASFAYGVWFTGTDEGKAYFSTLTRLWQLGLGCGLALALPVGLRLGRRAAGALMTAGLIALLTATAAFSASTPYPGWAALLPTLGTGAMIVAGTALVVPLPTRALMSAPMQYLGRLSYSWYLWHWPPLVFAAAVADAPLSVAQKTAIVLASWVPAALTHHLVEERFRRSPSLARRPRLAMGFGAACTATAVALAVLLSAVQNTVPTAKAKDAVGAVALAGSAPALQATAKALRPDPRTIQDDKGKPYHDGCHISGSPSARSGKCLYGDPRSDHTVFNIGDSHGLMYAPAMIELAERHRWRLVSLTRDGCTMADIETPGPCNEWREHVLERIEDADPDLVVVSNGTDEGQRYAIGDLSRNASQPILEDGFARTMQRLRATGARVVVIRDMSRAPKDIRDCVIDQTDALKRCAFAPNRRNSRSFDAVGAGRVPGVKIADPQPLLCPRQPNGKRRCPAVIGNVIVYRNDYHITATFATTMADWMGRQLDQERVGHR